MLTHFLDLLAAVISVTSLLIVTYGAVSYTHLRAHET